MIDNNISEKYVALNSKIIIVVAGQFHPGIFTPDWFEYHKIVSKEYCDNAQIKFIENSMIDIDFGWFRWFSDPQRILIELTTDGYDDQMLDLLRSILNMFAYTKISALGLNFEFNLNVNAEDDWHKIGHYLAPKDIWKDALKKEKLHYGMKQITIQVDDFYDTDSVLHVTAKAANDKNDKKHLHRLSFDFNNHFSVKEPHDWEKRAEFVLSEYFKIKNNNIQSYQKVLSVILGGDA